MRNNVVKAGETDSEDYEKALERVYQDMMSRHNDPEIIRMREDNNENSWNNLLIRPFELDMTYKNIVVFVFLAYIINSIPAS